MYKVLIVDDENLVRFAFRSIVNYEKHDFTVCGTAADGEEALKMCAQHNPDLVVTDIKMPKMDGITLIETLKKQGFTGQIVLISNYDDFDLVRQGMVFGAMDYLLKLTITAEEYEEMLDRVHKVLDETADRQRTNQQAQDALLMLHRQEKIALWKELISSRTLTLKDIPFNLFDRGPLQLYIIQIVQYGQVMKVSSQKDMTLLDFALMNIAGELLTPDDGCIGNLDGGRYFVVTLASEAHETSQFAASKLCSTLTKCLNVTTLALYDAFIDTPEKLLTVLSQIERIADIAFHCTSSSAFSFSELGKSGNWNVSISHFTNQLYNFLCAQDLQSACTLFDNELDQCRPLGVARREIQQKCIAILLRLCERLEDSAQIDLLKQCGQQISNIDTSDQLSSLLRETFKKFLSLTQVNLCQTGSHEVELILQYIHSHIGEKITLSQLAAHVNFNETYMCKVFRSHVGTSIVNYINQAKMEQAAVWLRESNWLLKNISAELGFNDQFYFNKMFRKYYGVSPSEYRKQHTKNTNHM